MYSIWWTYIREVMWSTRFTILLLTKHNSWFIWEFYVWVQWIDCKKYKNIRVSDRNWIIPWRRSCGVGISAWDASTPEEKEQASEYYYSYFQGFLPGFQGVLSTEMATPGTTPRILKMNLCFNYEFSNYLNRFSTPKLNANNLPS